MATPTTNNQKPSPIIGKFLAAIAVNGGAGYGFARIFTNLNPVAGAAFGASLLVLRCASNYITPKVCSHSTSQSRLFKVVDAVVILALAAFANAKLTSLLSIGLGKAAQIPGCFLLGYTVVIVSTSRTTYAIVSQLYNYIFKSNKA